MAGAQCAESSSSMPVSMGPDLNPTETAFCGSGSKDGGIDFPILIYRGLRCSSKKMHIQKKEEAEAEEEAEEKNSPRTASITFRVHPVAPAFRIY